VKDCAIFLPETFQSILDQTYRNLEVCIYDDGSKDDSVQIIQNWIPTFESAGFKVVFTQRPESAVTYVYMSMISRSLTRWIRSEAVGVQTFFSMILIFVGGEQLMLEIVRSSHLQASTSACWMPMTSCFLTEFKHR
jgi:hypothetical protein